MKALSIRQPWAWAIVHAGKQIENRTWRSNYRGWLLIHASGTQLQAQFDREEVNRRLARLGAVHPTLLTPDVVAAMPFGAIVGAAFVQDWDRIEDVAFRGPADHVWGEGPVCIMLGRVIALDRPIPCRGHVSLWTVPADVLAQVYEQLSPELVRQFRSASVSSV